MRRAPLVGLAWLAISVGAARAGTQIQLSTHSSDETPPSVLTALLDFSVSGSVLTLTVTNQTPAGNGYNINQLLFNATSNVTGLTLNPPVTGWSVLTNQHADSFGFFDFGLIDGVDMDPSTIFPQETQVFTLDISGTGPFSEADFTTEFSVPPPGEIAALAAAKFVAGPNGDSAFGAFVPEPATLVLLLPLVGMLCRR